MESAPFASDEAARQRALEELRLLDTPAEQEFDDITLLASFICEAPIALISLVDKDRQWFKSRVGLDIPETPRNIAFCAHAILGNDIFEVSDAVLDPRFADNPVVTNDPHLRFYAGVPLRTLDQHNVGTLCVIDRKPRQLTEPQRAALKALGRQVMRLVELRKATRVQAGLRHRLEAAARLGDIVRRSQEDFIARGPSNEMFDRLLGEILYFTGSEYGFIGEILFDEKEAPYLKTRAITNIAWNDATRKLYDEHKKTGMIFRNLHTLFGAAMTTGQPVVANHPATDSRRGGLPSGHPAMDNFLGLPFHYGDKLVGMIGMANRPGGYDDDVLDELAPLATSCAALVHAMRLDDERASTGKSLAREQERFRLIVDTAAEAFVEITDDGTVTEWNQHAAEEFRVPVGDALGRPIDTLFSLSDAQGTPSGLRSHVPGEAERRGQVRELTFVRGDGSRFQGELVMWSMPTGGERRYCAFIRNVTQRHELETQQRLRFQSETLLKEIHHRVKNNMQVISSLLSIQSAHLKDSAQRDVFLECRERIRAMSLIHDRLYSTGRYGSIDFGDYLREMVALITSSNRPGNADVHIDLQVEPVELSVEKAVPLSLIASELVLNSLKHAFHGRKEGTLQVRLSCEGGSCRLFVGDDGPGMRQTPDPDHAGVGLELIEGLTKQIKARRETRFDRGTGTSIIWKQ